MLSGPANLESIGCTAPLGEINSPLLEKGQTAMVPNYLRVICAALAPSVANHLWQSTAFALIAALLTLTLRKNQARARYWLWLAASVKFLVPFSLLVVIGSHLARPNAELHPAPAGGLYAAVQEVATVSDFLTVGLSQKPTANPQAVDRGYLLIHLIPVMLGIVWLCGLVVVLFIWIARWRRMGGALRAAKPLCEGREVNALRSVERAAGTRKPISMLLSRAHLEPGIFGVVRPVLVWPEGISERLDDAQVEAILAHELWHVRRRDNLAAAMHMAVEAIFWFHPLVWWLGGRLVEERERACDEAVLQLGNQPRAYAESILKTCEFCVRSPLACVCGVTGSDLKKRIVRIMTRGAARKLDARRKLVLGVAGFLAVAVPIGFGLSRPSPAPHSSSAGDDTAPSAPKFEVASIKPAKPGVRGRLFGIPPGRFTATNVTAKMLIEFAYNYKQPGIALRDDQILGGPKWINSESFDIEAKVEDSLVQQEENKLPFDQWGDQIKLMVQSMLVERFKLKVTHQTKELPVYVLVVAKNGPKLTKSTVPPLGPFGAKPPGPGARRGPMIRIGWGQLIGDGMSVDQLASALSDVPGIGGREIVNQTGLEGRYDVTLKWTPEGPRPMFGGPGPGGGPGTDEGAVVGQGPGSATNEQPTAGTTPAADSSGPSIFTAIQQQLGLRLKPGKAPVGMIVIDHIEQPTAN
jgi:bla regulator protein blaR1